MLGRSFIPNRSLDRKTAFGYGKDDFPTSFIALLASCCSLVLNVVHYAIEQTKKKWLNNPIKSVQNRISNLGLHSVL
jgi:hypothetical protein